MFGERWMIPPILALAAATSVVAFAPSCHRNTVLHRTRMAVDPNDVLSNHQHVWEALMSTLYATGDVLLKPAHEHTQPLWGPPDPYLLSGKSIAPLNPKAFIDAGLAETVKQQNGLPETVADAFDKVASQGINVINPAKILHLDEVLPGFQKSQHFLPSRSGPEETLDSLVLEMGSVAKLMRIMNQLPRVALIYTLVEFFLVRPGYDVYKEEVDEDRPNAAVEFLALTGTRLGLMSVIAALCLFLFDK